MIRAGYSCFLKSGRLKKSFATEAHACSAIPLFSKLYIVYPCAEGVHGWHVGRKK